MILNFKISIPNFKSSDTYELLMFVQFTISYIFGGVDEKYIAEIHINRF